MMMMLVALVATACATTDASHEQYEALTRKMFDAFNRHDWKVMSECYSDSASFLDPSFGKKYVRQRRSDIAEKYAGMQQMFPDLHDSVEAVHVSGHTAVVQFVATGSSGDSVLFRLPIISVLTFEGDHIVKDATYYDLEIQ
nr:nuclear transport factor 2 family protein [Chryseolinea lacunae]